MDIKEKVIAEIIDMNDRITPLERFLDDHHNCPLCGSELLLTHVTRFLDNATKETADCESCHIQVRSLDHALM